MERLRLLNGQEYVLVTNGVAESKDSISVSFLSDYGMDFSQIEAVFENELNISKMYIVNDSGETIRSITGYTACTRIKKTFGQVVSSHLDEITEETVETISDVFTVELAKPDLYKEVKDLRSAVDALVLSELEV